mmetsp:Transcript_3974/g.4654  ORF Transcript_3974/g.4654 Transcript_3974/m.4654 type:complete len:138 (-) Transcript_3974:36-449(-)
MMALKKVADEVEAALMSFLHSFAKNRPTKTSVRQDALKQVQRTSVSSPQLQELWTESHDSSQLCTCETAFHVLVRIQSFALQLPIHVGSSCSAPREPALPMQGRPRCSEKSACLPRHSACCHKELLREMLEHRCLNL